MPQMDIAWDDEPQIKAASSMDIAWDDAQPPPPPLAEGQLSLGEAAISGAKRFLPNVAEMAYNVGAGLSPYSPGEGLRVPPIATGLGKLAAAPVTGDYELWKALGADLKSKYGSYEGFKRAFAERPAE